MRGTIFVRVASVLTLLHAVLHTVGGVFGKAGAGPATVAVTAMKTNQFVAFGVQRTFWEFYMGLGLAVTIFLVMEAAVFWLLAPMLASRGREVRPILAVFAIGYLFFALDSFRYFFVGPVLVEGLIAACLIAAIIRSRKDAAAA